METTPAVSEGLRFKVEQSSTTRCSTNIWTRDVLRKCSRNRGQKQPGCTATLVLVHSHRTSPVWLSSEEHHFLNDIPLAYQELW